MSSILQEPKAKGPLVPLLIRSFVTPCRDGKSVRVIMDLGIATPDSLFVGLYTSPHLVAVRERIRINGIPLSEELFTKYFFEIWDRLVQNNKVSLLCR